MPGAGRNYQAAGILLFAGFNGAAEDRSGIRPGSQFHQAKIGGVNHRTGRHWVWQQQAEDEKTDFAPVSRVILFCARGTAGWIQGVPAKRFVRFWRAGPRLYGVIKHEERS